MNTNHIIIPTYHLLTLSTTCITLLMSSFALLLVSARTDLDIMLEMNGREAFQSYKKNDIVRNKQDSTYNKEIIYTQKP